MDNTPALFSETGVFMPMSQEQLDQMGTVEVRLYNGVRDASERLAQAERDLATCSAEIRSTMSEISEIETRLRSTKKVTFRDCFLASVAAQNARRH